MSQPTPQHSEPVPVPVPVPIPATAPALSRPRLGPWIAALSRRCPRCRDGRVFQSLFHMHSKCHVCGLIFDREYGYFTGAMYISYALGIALIAILTALFRSFIPTWPPALALAWIAFLPFAPWVFQYSRVLWIHFDRWIDPIGEERAA